MAKKASPPPASVPAALTPWFDPSQPWRAGFLAVMRAISARQPDAPLPGTASLPGEEIHRIGQRASLIFAPSEIAAVSQDAGKTRIELFGLGMWGPQGPLPLHMTEQAYSRVESEHDRTLCDFADLFHHRALSLFYRAWAAGQSTASLDRSDDERFTFYIASLIGDDPEDSAHLHPPRHARYGAASHLIREARNPEGLIKALAFYFNVDVQLEEYVPSWIALDARNQSRLGESSPSAMMGEQGVLGQYLPDCQHRFRIVMGPLDLDQYLRLTPHGDDLPTLRDWVRSFIGHEFDWELKLMIRPGEAPCAQLQPGQRLGYSTWLGQASRLDTVVGMIYEPERHEDLNAVKQGMP